LKLDRWMGYQVVLPQNIETCLETMTRGLPGSGKCSEMKEVIFVVFQPWSVVFSERQDSKSKMVKMVLTLQHRISVWVGSRMSVTRSSPILRT